MRPAFAALCCALALTSAGALPARADDATDQMQEALKAYDKGDYATALAALDAAESLVRQKRTERWQSLLPEPLAGWQADEPQSTTISPAVLGGGTTISRSYHRGGDSVEISIVLDSPIMQGLNSLVSNPFFTNGDVKVLVINGRKATFTKSENSYQVTIANKVLVVVKGGPTVGDDALKTYLGAINFSELEKNAQ
jgi:hypothetical protein